jgi:hypothetical protein
MSFGRSASEKETSKDLPSLGEGARPVETLRSSPYPKSSDNLP